MSRLGFIARVTDAAAQLLKSVASKRGAVEAHYEENKTALAVAGTLLSGAAAWLGYTAATLQQYEVERRLVRIQQKLEAAEQEHEPDIEDEPHIGLLLKLGLPVIGLVGIGSGFWLGKKSGFAFHAASDVAWQHATWAAGEAKRRSAEVRTKWANRRTVRRKRAADDAEL